MPVKHFNYKLLAWAGPITQINHGWTLCNYSWFTPCGTQTAIGFEQQHVPPVCNDHMAEYFFDTELVIISVCVWKIFNYMQGCRALTCTCTCTNQ